MAQATIDEIYRIVRWALFRNDRKKRLTMFAGEGDSSDVIQECVIAAMQSLSKEESSKFAISTIITNATNWTLSKLVRRRILREKSIERLSELRISQTTDSDAENKILFAEVKELVSEMLESLAFRKRKTLMLRYGFDEGKPFTLEEVGRVFRVTKERVRQIEMRALSEISRPSHQLKKLETAWQTK